MFQDLDFSDRFSTLTKNGLLVPIHTKEVGEYWKHKFKQATHSHIEWSKYDKDYVFEAKLQYSGYYTGKSTVSLKFTNDLFYGLMLFSDFDKLILAGIDISKPINGRWKFVKRGSGIGLILHEMF